MTLRACSSKGRNCIPGRNVSSRGQKSDLKICPEAETIRPRMMNRPLMYVPISYYTKCMYDCEKWIGDYQYKFYGLSVLIFKNLIAGLVESIETLRGHSLS